MEKKIVDRLSTVDYPKEKSKTEHVFLLDELLEVNNVIKKKLNKFLKKKKVGWQIGLIANDKAISVQFFKDEKFCYRIMK